MAKKSLEERFKTDILTDNVALNHCSQCKDCVYRDNGDVWSNDYHKSYCMMYEHPERKPLEVINNTGNCEWYDNG